MRVQQQTVIFLDGQAQIIEPGTDIQLSESGQLVTRDVQIIMGGERYLLEKGDKIAVTEGKDKSPDEDEYKDLGDEDEFDDGGSPGDDDDDGDGSPGDDDY